MIGIFFFWLVSLLFSSQKINVKDLPQKYREWLELTEYIILPQEKDVFMQLAADRDRDIFIETFWKQRDPTPGTPQNEYKDEHINRFLYANKYYRRGTTRPGWMTDMGRIHIILGLPASIEKFEGVAGIYPCQVWYYYGDRRKGLPTYFAVVFYQRQGSGEFKLYNQLSDGPANLLIDEKGLDLTNYRQVYEKIRELAPTLAGVSISMIPGEYPYNYQPSPKNNMILGDIFKSPKKDVSPSYATHFLNYKGVVSTEYLTNYVENTTNIALILDPILNIHFLHFSINPKSVSIDYFEPKDQYYCNFQLNVSLRKGENIISQYSKDFPFYFDPGDADRIRGSGISIQDSFPLIEGTYQLNILVQNSVGKEFSVFEKDISIPEPSELPKLIGPVLGYKLQDYSSHLRIPFSVADKLLLIDPQNTFSQTDDVAIFFSLMNVKRELWKEGNVEVFINGLREKDPVRKSFPLNLKDYPYNEILGIFYAIPARELAPDYYKMKLILKNREGAIIDEKDSNFIISPKEMLPHPATLANSFPLSNSFLYLYFLAYQYDKVNNYKKAEEFYKRAYLSKPDYKKGLIEYTHFLIKVKEFDKSLELVENLKDDEDLRFEYYLIKGKAYMGIGKYPKAIENLLEGNKIYNSDIRLLNALGFCYYKTSEEKKALEVLKASLRLNPGQKEVKKLVEEIEKDSN
ncbi:MAG: GWxTD domain-containing protein [Candidatus Aminicenantes bacterium]|nr:GWxTD domain-containing protein [Candidatus Aminicenantes bacterium]